MKYLLLICSDDPTAPEDVDVIRREVPKWVDEMEGRGVRLVGRPLQDPSTAATVRVRNGETLVSDGPFAEAKEHVAGFDIVECADLDEAIEVAAKHPLAWFKTIEIRPFFDGLELGPAVEAFGRSEDGDAKPYCMFMCLDGIAGEPDEEAAILRDSRAWGADLKARGLMILGHPVQHKDVATTVRVRNGETLITDGPFVETTEFIGGIAVASCTSREQAIELAAKHPLAEYHMVEVRPFWD